MRPSADSERLLDEVLDESADFRGQSLHGLLREARRHQHRRQRLRAARVVLVAVCVIAGVTALLRNSPQTGPAPQAHDQPLPRPDSVLLVRSMPLPATMWVETRPASVAVIRSIPTSIPQVDTPRDTAFFREISDGELFTLLGGRPAALVRLQSGQKELLLLDQ